MDKYGMHKMRKEEARRRHKKGICICLLYNTVYRTKRGTCQEVQLKLLLSRVNVNT